MRGDWPPHVGEAIAGVPPFPRFVGSGDHFREKIYFLALALQGESDGGQARLAVVVMTDAGAVLAVGDCSFSHVVAEKFVRAGDGGLEFGLLNAATVREDDGNETRQPRHVHGAVGRARGMEVAVLIRADDAMTPRAEF